MMKDADYTTGHIGKWHLGYTPETMPNAQGFDYPWGYMGGCIDNYSHFFFWKGPNRHDLWRNGEHINEDGIDWFRTIAEFCGIELPGHYIDGVSIKNVILSETAKSPHDAFYWQLGKVASSAN